MIREPIDLSALRANLLQTPGNRDLLEALNSLQRRSLIERQADGFALQNVITEYLTDRLVERAFAELAQGELDLLHRHPLLMAEAKEYVRESQVRLIVRPLIEQIVGQSPIGQIKLQCQQLLDQLRSRGPRLPSYAGGTILNLLIHLHSVARRREAVPYSLAHCDFSKLVLWQAHLRGAMLPAVNFAESDLAHSTFTQALGLAMALAVSRDGQLLAVGGSGNEITIWQLSDFQLVMTLRGPSYDMSAVAFSPNGSQVACVSRYGIVCTWDLQTGRQLWSVEVSKAALYCVTFSPDGRYFASAGGYQDHTIQLWDMSSKQWFATLTGSKERVLELAFSPDGALLASGGEDGVVYLWDVSSPRAAQLRHILHGHGQLITNLTFNRSGVCLGSFSTDHTIRFWDTATGDPLHMMTDPNSAEILQFSPTADTLACWASGDTIRVVDTATLPDETEVMVLEGHQSTLKSVSFSPTGDRLVSGSLDQSVQLWDLNDGRQLFVLEEHEASVTLVRFSPDGRHFLSSSLDGTIRLWDAETGHCVHIFHTVGPYAGMKISGVTGISAAQRAALKALGAVE